MPNDRVPSGPPLALRVSVRSSTPELRSPWKKVRTRSSLGEKMLLTLKRIVTGFSAVVSQ